MLDTKKPVSLNHADILKRSKRADSDGIYTERAGEHFNNNNDQGVIRYRIQTPEFLGSHPVLLSFRYSIDVAAGQATHISIVNANVSDGAIWKIEPSDCVGTYTLSAILKPPLHEITIYINLNKGSGQFCIEKLSGSRLAGTEPLSICFFVDPWVERCLPQWKSDYIWWFGRLYTALREAGVAVKAHFVFEDHLENFWDEYKPDGEVTYTKISSRDLIEIYGSSRLGIKEQRLHTREGSNRDRQRKFVKLIQASVPSTPDVVFSMSDMQLLRDAFPDSLVLFRDAIYCREPFPDEMTSFDPFGLYHNASFSKIVSRSDQHPEYLSLVQSFFSRDEAVATLLQEHGIRENEFILLPLQDSRHVNFYDESTFSDQMDLIIACLRKFPDRNILVTQHPDNKEISEDAIIALENGYSNFKYIRQLEEYKNPTARLIPLCGGVAGVSTGLLYQAMMCGKAVHLLGKHALSSLDISSCTSDELRKIGYSLLLRVFASCRYNHDGRWLWTRLALLKQWQRGTLPPEALAIDLPGNIFQCLRDTSRPVGVTQRVLTLDREAIDENWDAASELPRRSADLILRKDILKIVRPGGIGIELGVAEGHFSRELLGEQRLSYLYSVDMYSGDRGHGVNQYLEALRNLSSHKAQNTLIRMRFDHAINLFPDEYFDLIYVDGYAHDGQLGGRTIEQWYPKLRSGGVISGHDYCSMFPRVVEAVDSFARRHSLKIETINDSSGGWNFGASSWFAVKSTGSKTGN